MAEVFISYSRQDREAAEAIARELQQLGVEVWWDHDLLGGEDYRQSISKLLERTDAAIVIWSARSVDSQWVMSEAAAAARAESPRAGDDRRCRASYRFPRPAHDGPRLLGPGRPAPLPLLKSLSERLGREIGYDDADIPRAGAVARLAKRTTQAWYADFETCCSSSSGRGSPASCSISR